MYFLYIMVLNHDNILSIVKSYIFKKCTEKEEISCLPLDIVLLHYWCLILYGFTAQNKNLKHSRKMLIFMDSNMFMTLFSVLGGGRKWDSKNMYHHRQSSNTLSGTVL